MRPFHWFDKQIKQRPFFSALIVLLLVVIPGYARLESTVNKSDKAATASQSAAQSAERTAKALEKFVKQENARDAANNLENCHTRNIATKHGRDRFDVFFNAIAVLIVPPTASEQQKQQAHQFVERLRAAVPLDPKLEDVDCNGDGELGPADYG